MGFEPTLRAGRYRVHAAFSASHSESIPADVRFMSRGWRRPARSGMMPWTTSRSRSARSAAP